MQFYIQAVYKKHSSTNICIHTIWKQKDLGYRPSNSTLNIRRKAENTYEWGRYKDDIWQSDETYKKVVDKVMKQK